MVFLNLLIDDEYIATNYFLRHNENLLCVMPKPWHFYIMSNPPLDWQVSVHLFGKIVDNVKKPAESKAGFRL